MAGEMLDYLLHMIITPKIRKGRDQLVVDIEKTLFLAKIFFNLV